MQCQKKESFFPHAPFFVFFTYTYTTPVLYRPKCAGNKKNLPSPEISVNRRIGSTIASTRKDLNNHANKTRTTASCNLIELAPNLYFTFIRLFFHCPTLLELLLSTVHKTIGGWQAAGAEFPFNSKVIYNKRRMGGGVSSLDANLSEDVKSAITLRYEELIQFGVQESDAIHILQMEQDVVESVRVSTSEDPGGNSCVYSTTDRFNIKMKFHQEIDSDHFRTGQCHDGFPKEFPMFIMRGSCIKSLDRLIRHEEAISRGILLEVRNFKSFSLSKADHWLDNTCAMCLTNGKSISNYLFPVLENGYLHPSKKYIL